MHSSIVLQGILALIIDPNSSKAKQLEEVFSKTNSDGYGRITKSSLPLYKVTLVSQRKVKMAVDSLALKHNISKGKARKMLSATLAEKVGDWDISDRVLFEEDLVPEQDIDKEGVERRSLVSYVKNQSELEILVDVICGALGLSPDIDRRFHMSVYNLTGEAGDSPSLMP